MKKIITIYFLLFSSTLLFASEKNDLKLEELKSKLYNCMKNPKKSDCQFSCEILREGFVNKNLNYEYEKNFLYQAWIDVLNNWGYKIKNLDLLKTCQECKPILIDFYLKSNKIYNNSIDGKFYDISVAQEVAEKIRKEEQKEKNKI